MVSMHFTKLYKRQIYCTIKNPPYNLELIDMAEDRRSLRVQAESTALNIKNKIYKRPMNIKIYFTNYFTTVIFYIWLCILLSDLGGM